MYKRKQLPPLLKEVLQVSQYLTLYQVESHPPCKFTFIDPLDNPITVNIGTVPNCSCLPGNRDHCMHTFYVLTKVYQLQKDDPLLYQPQYTHDQLVDIFSGERAKNYLTSKKKPQGKEQANSSGQKRQEKMKQAKEIPFEYQKTIEKQNERTSVTVKQESTVPQVDTDSNKQQQAKESSCKKQPMVWLPSLADSKEARPNFKKKSLQIGPKQQYQAPSELQKGAICSICYQPLLNQTALLKCAAVCHNFFHTKCLRFWIDYQRKQQLQTSCPMCRGKFPFNIANRLKQSQHLFFKRYLSFEENCIQCGSEIHSRIFRCLQCCQGCVCEECYMGFKHPVHDRYLMRSGKESEWSVPIDRSRGGMAKLEVSLKYVKQFKSQQQMKSLFGANYDKFLQANLRRQTVLELVIGSLTSVEKEIYKTYKKIDYEQKDIRCVLCKKGKITQMRRLGCKHFMDEKCLSFMLVSGERRCPFDNTFILPCFEKMELPLGKKQ